MSVDVDVVIPTVGRESLDRLLEALEPQRGLLGDVLVMDGRGRSPAAARNAGWRSSRAEWVAFLDDDVVPDPDWAERLQDDLADAGAEVAAVQGRIRVPLPSHRRPTDWERNVAGLETARWATADMAYRRADLLAAGGFDERFPRAYREDADLGLRTIRRGRRIVMGRRGVTHPVGPAGAMKSLTLQAGNADDALMRALHGPGWREDAGAPPGRFRRHAATAAAGVAAVGAAVAGRRRAAVAGALAWAAGAAELAWARIAPGPRTPREVATMLGTSALMPFAAIAWRLAGYARLPRLLRDTARAPRPEPVTGAAPMAVLLDRDGTLVVDVPYNGDPDRVEPMPGAREALDRLRAAGVPLAVVSNQSGVGRGLISQEQVDAVNRRVEELLGPLGPFLVCPHAPDAGCDCRKPAPGLVLRAAERLAIPPALCVVIGDIGADVEAARAAGAGAVLVPTPRTRREEVAAAPVTAPDLVAAVDLLVPRPAELEMAA